MDQLGDTEDIAINVVDILALVNSSRDAIYRFVGIDVGHIRSAPLKVFHQLKTNVLILVSSPLSISVECGEKAVECGLSENPFVFGSDFGETHVLILSKQQNFNN
jgi:hypothetical protein